MLTGKDLKVMRIILDIKAVDIAKELNVHRSYISIMERGIQDIPKHIRVKWEKYLYSIEIKTNNGEEV